ncbi:MAG: hypothetical protein U1F77_19955 [Kiritimatiellia bacterium]
MKKGSGDRYGQNSSGKLVPEGCGGRVPYKGPRKRRVPAHRRTPLPAWS